MKRTVAFILGTLLCAPTLFGAPRDAFTILGLALIGTVIAAQFIIENERNKT